RRRWVPCRTRTAAAWLGSDAATLPERKQPSAHRQAPRRSAGVREAERNYVSQNHSWATCYNNDSIASRSNAAERLLRSGLNPTRRSEPKGECSSVTIRT